MAKHKLQEVAQSPAPVALESPGLKLTHPLFGIARGLDADRYCAVRVLDGKVESLTPRRGNRDSGERVHFATARALEAFQQAMAKRGYGSRS